VECPSTDIAASDPAWVIELFLSCVDEGPNEGTIAHLIILIKFVTDSRIETCKALNKTVGQLVEALRYKPKGRGFDSQ